MAPNNGNPAIDPRSGFCKSNSIFYSKRKPTPHPPNHSLDFTTFISSRAHHGKVAFVDASTGRQLTFANLWRAVDSVATFLSDNGFRKGHVILILSPNSVFVPAVCLAAISLGAVITTANPLNTAGEIVKQIADSKPVLAFTTRQLVQKLSESPNLIRIVLLDEQSKPAVESPRIVATLEEMLKKQPRGTRRVTDRVNQDDTAALLYSSGTTGASKGVETSHKNFIAVAQILIGRFGLDEGEHRFLCVAPMFHIYGLVYALALPASGTTAVILSKYDMHDMLSAIEKYRITNTSLVPPVLVALVKGADEIRSRYDLSSLRTVSCGGAPMSKEVIEKVVERYPTVAILQAYGLTESTAVGATTNSLEESRRYGTVGLLSPNMEAKIVESKTGEALSMNRTGEIWLRGPPIMKGYFLNAEATALTLDPEGWLKTGDLCYIDDDGFIFVVDRLKELIKYKGYQVPPAELEALLLTHPEIFDVAVIPFPDKEVGQYPMAYVVRKAGSNLSEGAVMDFVAGQVAPYKKIRRVAFIASIPKNQSGKILRKDLVQLATSKL